MIRRPMEPEEHEKYLAQKKREMSVMARTMGKLGGLARAMALPPEQKKAIAKNAASLGGRARAAKLSPEQRSAIARQASLLRWRKLDEAAMNE